jgi:hypothetical protein
MIELIIVAIDHPIIDFSKPSIQVEHVIADAVAATRAPAQRPRLRH